MYDNLTYDAYEILRKIMQYTVKANYSCPKKH